VPSAGCYPCSCAPTLSQDDGSSARPSAVTSCKVIRVTVSSGRTGGCEASDADAFAFRRMQRASSTLRSTTDAPGVGDFSNADSVAIADVNADDGPLELQVRVEYNITVTSLEA